MSFFNPADLVAATIADTDTVSGIVNLEGLRAFGLVVPGTIAGANITFEVSNDGSTWYELYKNDNTALSVGLTAGAFIGFGEWIAYFAPWQYLRLTTDVAASGDEAFQIAARDL